MKSILRAVLAIVAVPLLLFASSVSAEETQAKRDNPDRFMIRGGYLLVFGAETDVQLVGQSGLGAVIDFNKTLHGTQDYSGFRVDAAYRFNDRHSMGLSYYRVLRNANRQIASDLTVGDTTIAAGAQTTSNLNFDMYRLTYNYSFYRTDKVEVGITPGLYIMRVKFDLTGSATCSGAQATCVGQPTVFGSASEQLTVPLPSIGGFVNYKITPKLTAQVRSDFFYLKVASSEGSMFEFYAGLEYRLFKHFALGASFDRLQSNVDLTKDGTSKGFAFDNSWNTGFFYGALYF
jgi:Outer membrane protein beta-barrel domain